MQLISLENARVAGVQFYFTGRPCANGHVSKRSVAKRQCSQCICEKRAAYVARNSEKLRERAKQNYSRNRSARKEYVAKRRIANLDHAKKLERARYQRRAVKARAAAKAWRIANREKYLAEKRATRERKREKIAEYMRAWRLKNKEHIRRYDQANPEIRIASTSRRRAFKLRSQDTHTADDIKNIFRMQRWRCAYCSIKIAKGAMHVDHIVALSKGGSNGPRNLQILCIPCNLSKSAKDPIVFARQIGMLL